MIFSEKTLQIGGKMVVPDSFINSKDPCEIISMTHFGVNVVYRKDTDKAQVAFYAYDWLNQMYGPKKIGYSPTNTSGLDDEVPWDL